LADKGLGKDTKENICISNYTGNRKAWEGSTNFSFFFCLYAQIPQNLSYQGVLKDATGVNVPNGDYPLTFNLYPVQNQRLAIWIEVQTVTVTDGIFNVILGSVNPLNVAFNAPYWLGVTVGTGSELLLIPLTSSAYILNAKTVMDSSITTAKLVNGAVTLPKISSSGVSAGDVLTYNGSNLTWQTPAGGGIGGGGTVDYLLRFTGSNTLGNTSLLYNSSWGGILVSMTMPMSKTLNFWRIIPILSVHSHRSIWHCFKPAPQLFLLSILMSPILRVMGMRFLEVILL